MADVEVQATGPVFDGRAQAAMKTCLDEVEQTVGDAVLTEMYLILDQSLENPTGHYRSRVRTERQRDDVAVVDRGVVYGAWLVGVGSRNDISQFKGYDHFRRAQQAAEPKAPQVAEDVVRKHIGKME